jgi:uncharacterized protein YggE
MLKQIFSQSSIEEYIKFGFGSLITIVVAVSSIIVTSKFIGPLPIAVSQTTTEKASTFDITGTSEIATIPDQAEVTVGITVNQNTVAAAQNQANQVINNITESVRQLGVTSEDIKTVNFNVNPRYNYDANPAEIEGYSVATSVRVKVKDLDKINQVIDTATANGANRVNGISFTISDEKEEELRKQARKEAIEDAKESAKELANLADMRLGKIVDISENNTSGADQPIMYARAELAVADAGEAPTSVEPGSTSYTYQVTLSYETL